ncbi:MAG: hypothetical protein G3M78_07915 [Candidatus Nitrohelix vancouverensis]|uniref:Heparin-sulfate lyase N-terminal domain-containing protein n=1 Tax=Candidatus Nitrohelix vancouverensis TaxID=2705534 RepID=A0A7T0C2F4_9BACT|nr:MAG: hypothetical protein G3M78_07915 [Candidatus Nitrohelix vancouverensis]
MKRNQFISKVAPFLPVFVKQAIKKSLSALRNRPMKKTGPSSFSLQLNEAGTDFPSWLETIKSQKPLYTFLSDDKINDIRNDFPEAVQHCIADADQILRHEFDFLGSGPFTPKDPKRKPRHNGYLPIDWYLDPKLRLRFPEGIPHKEWELYSMRPGNADIKFPWELSRCQHWATLGQAFLLTKESKYADEIRDQLVDFMEANPVGIGINWTCTMDVALRAANWAIGLSMTQNALSSEFIEEAYEALFDHGHFIFNNLENNYEVTSNHFLSNISGLFYLACIFKELPAGAQWLSYCRKHLEKEISVQILDDGADYESSVPYHRLVVELFLGPARLAELHSEPFSKKYYQQLENMMDFFLGTLRPDGLMPQIGDADDGRLHIFSGYGQWRPQDGRHLLAPASSILNRPDWMNYISPKDLWEAAWWGLDYQKSITRSQAPPDTFKLFPEAGLAVYRTQSVYLLISNGIVGTKGFGNHKHNDQLSFEYHRNDDAVFVDPGSYVYTSDPEARNLFRSTGYHNTLTIDGVEQNETNPEWLFRLIEAAQAEHISWNEAEHYAQYHGKHVGYSRLEQAVVHERCFRLYKKDGSLFWVDQLTGSGAHRLHWHYHTAPGVKISQENDDDYLIHTPNHELLFKSSPALRGRIDDAHYSPSYGKRMDCLALNFDLDETLEGTHFYGFGIVPQKTFNDADFQKIISELCESLSHR